MGETNFSTDYLLELAAAGELPADAQRRILDAARTRTGQNPLEALARDAEETLARHPPGRVTDEVARRMASRRKGIAWFVPILACAFAVVLTVVLHRRAAPFPSGEEGVRWKGLAPHLVVHRRTPAGIEPVAPGATVRAGDLVQLGYISAGRPYGAIVSVDGGGGVTRHWPATEAAAASLESGREVLLPESFRLDEAPGFERFFFITSHRRFDVATVLAAARTLAARSDAREARLRLDPGLEEAELLLEKENRL